jgi:NodT family efflux transporter outer membrane factor (OMF) lipoprotein
VAVVPPDYANAEVDSLYQPLAWWTAYEDTTLNRLVAVTLDSNLDLVEAFGRVLQARAQYGIQRAGLLPSVQGSADASYQTQPANTGVGAAFGGGGGGGMAPDSAGGGAEPPSRVSFQTYRLALGVSYELDLFGRVRNETRAAISDAIASEDDLEAVRLAVLSQTIGAYFDAVELRRRIEVTTDIVRVLGERVAVTERRYRRGLTASFELYALLQQLRQVQAGLPVLEAQLADVEGRLALVLGQYAERIDGLLGAPLRPRLVLDPVPPGLPAALLVQRPDVRAAARRFEAARYRVGAARAELFPRVSLSGSVGLEAGEPLNVFRIDQWVANLAGGLTQPIFDGGRIRAGIDAAEARYLVQAAGYARAVLDAFREVEAALERYEEQSQRYRLVLAQRDEADATADLQARRYRSGTGDITDYLDAARTLLQSELDLAAAGRAAAAARLDVHRALGGGWVEPAEAYPDGVAAPTLGLVQAPVPLPDADGLPPLRDVGIEELFSLEPGEAARVREALQPAPRDGRQPPDPSP